jgi:hypothetical protein
VCGPSDLARRKEARASFYSSTTFHDASWSSAIASNGKAPFGQSNRRLFSFQTRHRSQT